MATEWNIQEISELKLKLEVAKAVKDILDSLSKETKVKMFDLIRKCEKSKVIQNVIELFFDQYGRSYMSTDELMTIDERGLVSSYIIGNLVDFNMIVKVVDEDEFINACNKSNTLQINAKTECFCDGSMTNKKIVNMIRECKRPVRIDIYDEDLVKYFNFISDKEGLKEVAKVICNYNFIRHGFVEKLDSEKCVIYSIYDPFDRECCAVEEEFLGMIEYAVKLIAIKQAIKRGVVEN